MNIKIIDEKFKDMHRHLTITDESGEIVAEGYDIIYEDNSAVVIEEYTRKLISLGVLTIIEGEFKY